MAALQGIGGFTNAQTNLPFLSRTPLANPSRQALTAVEVIGEFQEGCQMAWRSSKHPTMTAN